MRELLEGNEEKFKGGAGGYVDSSAAADKSNASAIAAALGTPGFGTPKVRVRLLSSFLCIQVKDRFKFQTRLLFGDLTI